LTKGRREEKNIKEKEKGKKKINNTKYFYKILKYF